MISGSIPVLRVGARKMSKRTSPAAVDLDHAPPTGQELHGSVAMLRRDGRCTPVGRSGVCLRLTR